MYSYTFDIQTGGILLNSTPTNFSKEPRPVYAQEMDILGFDQYWEYEKQNDVPYMWAESNLYWYRGVQIAKIKGGDLYTKPELQPAVNENGIIPFNKESGCVLEKIDIPAMCKANAELMQVIEDSTVKRIVKAYEKYKNKLDIFHVAFSGGKDSAVLLDLVKKALPKDSFVVIFGDTGMEFPDTYDVVKKTQEQCEKDGTHFYIAKSHFKMPNKELKYCEYFNVNEKYFPCIDESAINSGVSWQATYPHEAFISLLNGAEKMLGGITNKSLWIHGAYGTGTEDEAHRIGQALCKILQ